MELIARYLLVLGAILFIAGGVLYLIARSGLLSSLPLGRLPGDIRFQSGGITCIFPLATMIILSIVLTILLNVIVRLLNK